MTGPTATPRPGVSVQPSPYAVPHSPSARWTPAGPPIPQFRVGPKQIDWLPNQDLVDWQSDDFEGGSNGTSHGFTDGIFDFGFNTGLTPTYTNTAKQSGSLSLQIDSAGTGTCSRSINVGQPLSATVGLETAVLGVQFFIRFETFTTVTAAVPMFTVNDVSNGTSAVGANIAQLALRAPANNDFCLRDNVTASASGFSPVPGTWYRCEWLLDQNAGRQRMRIYEGAVLYSIDPADASVDYSTSLTAVASRISQLRLGVTVASGNALKVQIDDFGYDTRGWVSDYNPPSSGSQSFNQTLTAAAAGSGAVREAIAITRAAAAALAGAERAASAGTRSATVTTAAVELESVRLARQAVAALVGAAASARSYLRTFAAAVTTSAAARRAATHARAATAATVAALVLVRAYVRTLAATVTTALTARETVNVTRSATVAGVAAQSSSRAFLRTVLAAVTTVAALRRQPAQVRAAAGTVAAARGASAVAAVRAATAATAPARRSVVSQVRSAAVTLTGAASSLKARFLTVTATVRAWADPNLLAGTNPSYDNGSIITYAPATGGVAGYFSCPLAPGTGRNGGVGLQATTNSAVNPQGMIHFAREDMVQAPGATVVVGAWVNAPAGTQLNMAARWNLADGIGSYVGEAGNSYTLFTATGAWQWVGTPSVTPGVNGAGSTSVGYVFGIELFLNTAASGVVILMDDPVVLPSTSAAIAFRAVAATRAAVGNLAAARLLTAQVRRAATATTVAAASAIKAKFQTLVATATTTAARSSQASARRAATATGVAAARGAPAKTLAAGAVTAGLRSSQVSIRRGAATVTTVASQASSKVLLLTVQAIATLSAARRSAVTAVRSAAETTGPAVRAAVTATRQVSVTTVASSIRASAAKRAAAVTTGATRISQAQVVRQASAAGAAAASRLVSAKRTAAAVGTATVTNVRTILGAVSRGVASIVGRVTSTIGAVARSGSVAMPVAGGETRANMYAATVDTAAALSFYQVAGGGTNGTITKVDDTDGSIKVTGDGAADYQGIQTFPTNRPAASPSTTYTATVYVKGDATSVGKTIGITIHEFNAAGAYVTESGASIVLTLGWQRLTVTRTLTAAGAFVGTAVRVVSTARTQSIWWARSIRIYPGNPGDTAATAARGSRAGTQASIDPTHQAGHGELQ